ncbi:hypothetical protein EUX98_g9250 [Antrodiella citrinella]|uniref:Uncharacterized protein n=1 Tax=Antrodiella citrinella TaxID=2447956 RepID=A0A4S4LWM0_9APHY|nr:hypothetical protein EUX98_g9250 [Antrodiella citrinella]
MTSHIRAPIFAAALTQVIQWLDFKTFGRVSWYDRAIALLREASDAAPSLDDMKLAEARREVRAAVTSKVLTTHPPDAFFEELAMPVTPAGATIFASELDELDLVTGKDHALQAARIEERWAEADALWRVKAVQKVTQKIVTKSNARPRPVPRIATPEVPPAPKTSTKRKEAPISSDEEDDVSPPPVRSGTQTVVPSRLYELTPGRLVVGKTPVAQKVVTKSAARPARAVRRRRPVWSTKTDDEDDDEKDDDFSDNKPGKKDTSRAAKRSKGVKSEREAFPDEDPEAELSSWFIYRELQKCLKCSSSRSPSGVVCRMYEGETRCRRCSRTAQGCYWEISPGAIPVSYSGAHKQTRDSTTVSVRAGVQPHPVPAPTLFVAHSESPSPRALARIHPDSQPASRAIADVVEQSLVSAQVQLSTGLLLARSLLRDGAPGFRGADADPAELEEPLDSDLPEDFTEDPNHPISFRMEVTPPVIFDGPPSPSPAPSGPPRPAEAVEPSAHADSRRIPGVSSDAASPGIAMSPNPSDEAMDNDVEGSGGVPSALEGVDELDDAGSGEGEGDDNA